MVSSTIAELDYLRNRITELEDNQNILLEAIIEVAGSWPTPEKSVEMHARDLLLQQKKTIDRLQKTGQSQ